MDMKKNSQLKQILKKILPQLPCYIIIWKDKICIEYNRKLDNIGIGTPIDTVFPELASYISTVEDLMGKEYFLEFGGKEYNVYFYKEGDEVVTTLIEQSTRCKILANVSHELRTPLSCIIGMTGLLIDTELTSEQLDYVESIRQCGYTLMSTINDILDMSKLEIGKIFLDEVPFSLRECIESSFDIVSIKARENNISTSFYIEPDVPPFVIGDPQRLQQILVNILINGIKFNESPQGYVDLRVSVLKVFPSSTPNSKETEYEILFSVKDNGIGISEESKHKLFRPFSQLDASTTKTRAGSGLGLAISKRLVELYGGKIWVESKVGVGSTFFFTIRVREHHKLDENLLNCSLCGKNILVVDDKLQNRISLCSQLLKWKMKPVACSSGEEALIYFRNGFIFDLAFIDICMPNMDGFQLAQEIHKFDKNLPLVALSSLGDKTISNSLFKYHLVKPVKEGKLLNICVELLAEKKMEERLPGPKDPQSNLRILSAEDIQTNQKVLKFMLNKLGHRNIDFTYDGLETKTFLDQNKYDIIFLDIKMPKMSGYTIASELYKKPLSERPYIIGCTANVSSSDREKYLKVMDALLIKPITLEDLRHAISKALSKKFPSSSSSC
jgi:CheY-like chemotaxis protein